MSNVQRIALTSAFLFIVGSIGGAGEKRAYQTGKLIDVRSHGRSFCLAIQVEDMSYIVTAPWTSTTLIVGDPITVRIRFGKRGTFWDTSSVMYIKTAKSHLDDEKVPIVRVERITSDKKPATCALPVAIEPH